MNHPTHEYNTSWEKVRRVFPEGEGFQVLDLGCGDGTLTRELTTKHRVSGIDDNADAVRKAKEVGIDAVYGSFEHKLPFADQAFTVVLALDVFEHVLNLDGLLTEIQRVMQPDGFLIISMPNHFDLRTRIDILRGKGIIRWSQRAWEKEPWNYSHIRFLTISDIRRMLQKHGWYIDVEQFNFMSGGVLPTRLLPSFFRSWLVRAWPAAWSGKIVMRARLQPSGEVEQIYIDRTPENF